MNKKKIKLNLYKNFMPCIEVFIVFIDMISFKKMIFLLSYHNEIKR